MAILIQSRAKVRFASSKKDSFQIYDFFHLKIFIIQPSIYNQF